MTAETCDLVAEIICSHVSSPITRAAIVEDLEALAEELKAKERREERRQRRAAA